MYKVPVWRADQIYSRMLNLYQHSPQEGVVKHLSATCYALEKADHSQLTLYDDDFTRQNRIQSAMNLVNDRYGAFTVQPASQPDPRLARVAGPFPCHCFTRSNFHCPSF